MKSIVVDTETIAFCGLYCGACKKYRVGKCPGCAKNDKASWCKVRTCCLENDFRSCADCTKLASVAECKSYNNLLAKLFGILFRSDRKACIELIRKDGYQAYAERMTRDEAMTIRR